MNKLHENGKAASVWFGIVDILIILILAGFIASLFLIDETGGGSDENDDAPRLTFAVAVQAPYDVDLFLQEGKGEAIPLRFDGGSDAFGWLFLGDDGQFYVECVRSAVRSSEDLAGLWYLGDTMLLNGTTLSVQSKLADFSVTLLTLPELTTPGSVGTTEALPTDTEEPVDDDVDMGVSEGAEITTPIDDGTTEDIESDTDTAANNPELTAA